MNARQRIDWDEVRSRLATSQSALEQSRLPVDATRLEAVYRDRARRFAGRSTNSVRSQDAWPALTFTVGPERLCIELAALVEVLPYAKCAPLAGAGAELLGVINVRGRICSVLDLARILGLPEQADRTAGYIVLARQRGIEIGFRVDNVERIASITSAELEDSASDLSALNACYIRGRATEGAAVVDLEAVCSQFVFRSELTTANHPTL
jgi:purine-binding chemotaxis protein CheW